MRIQRSLYCVTTFLATSSLIGCATGDGLQRFLSSIGQQSSPPSESGPYGYMHGVVPDDSTRNVLITPRAGEPFYRNDPIVVSGLGNAPPSFEAGGDPAIDYGSSNVQIPDTMVSLEVGSGELWVLCDGRFRSPEYGVLELLDGGGVVAHGQTIVSGDVVAKPTGTVFVFWSAGGDDALMEVAEGSVELSSRSSRWRKRSVAAGHRLRVWRPTPARPEHFLQIRKVPQQRLSYLGKEIGRFTVASRRVINAVGRGPVSAVLAPPSRGVARLGRLPRTIGFQHTFTHSTSPQQLTIQNTGSAELRVDAIKTRGAMFSTSVTKVSIPPRTKKTISVYYKPTKPGKHKGSLTLSTNDPRRPTVEISLKGSADYRPPH